MLGGTGMGTGYATSDNLSERPLDEFDRYSTERGLVWGILGIGLIAFWMAIGLVAYHFASSFV